MAHRPIETLSTVNIERLLERDGYYSLIGRAAEIKRAAVNGALFWGQRRLKTTDESRIDAVPED